MEKKKEREKEAIDGEATTRGDTYGYNTRSQLEGPSLFLRGGWLGRRRETGCQERRGKRGFLCSAGSHVMQRGPEALTPLRLVPLASRIVRRQ